MNVGMVKFMDTMIKSPFTKQLVQKNMQNKGLLKKYFLCC